MVFFQSLDYDRCINDPYLEVLESMDNKVGIFFFFPVFSILRAKAVESPPFSGPCLDVALTRLFYLFFLILFLNRKPETMKQ